MTKLSFSVIKADKEMLLFPLMAGTFSMLFVLVLLFPTVIVGINSGDSMGALDYVLMFITYFGLAFIATFFNVCVVYTTKTRFEGGDATFKDSWQFAMSRLPQIAQWALVSASVGMFLRLLDALAEKVGGIGEMVIKFLVSLLGMAWTVVTLFVIPTMVYENVGPKVALQRSVETLKQTWGESLMRHYGLGLIQFLFMLLGVLVSVMLLATIGQLGGFGMGLAILMIFAMFLTIILVFNVANNVFNTALYCYAKEGTTVGGFDAETIRNAFRQRSGR